jgi:hypothetical protein
VKASNGKSEISRARASYAECRHALLLLPPALPALHYRGVDAKQVEQAADGVIDDVVDCLGPVVERRHDRGDDQFDCYISAMRPSESAPSI